MKYETIHEFADSLGFEPTLAQKRLWLNYERNVENTWMNESTGATSGLVVLAMWLKHRRPTEQVLLVAPTERCAGLFRLKAIRILDAAPDEFREAYLPNRRSRIRVTAAPQSPIQLIGGSYPLPLRGWCSEYLHVLVDGWGALDEDTQTAARRTCSGEHNRLVRVN